VDQDKLIQRSARAAANGYMYSFGEMLEQRAHQSLPHRLMKVMFAKSLAAMVPRASNFSDREYELLAAGGQQLVYASGGDVVKVVMSSLSLDKERSEAVTMEYQENYEAAKPHLGERMTDTEFDLRRFRGGLFAAIAIQPRLQPTKEFIDVNELIFFRDDEAYTGELQGLLDGLTSLYSATSLQMDLNGPKNIFLTDTAEGPHTEIVDTIVVSPEMQRIPDLNAGMITGETIRRKMSILREAISVNPVEPSESLLVAPH
jgi:hypothetical protein